MGLEYIGADASVLIKAGDDNDEASKGAVPDRSIAGVSSLLDSVMGGICASLLGG